MSHARVEIDLNALQENYRAVRSRIPDNVKMLCVVKADAYGHGAVAVARSLQSDGADYLGVATVEEGEELRKSGISLPVLVMGGVMPWDSIGEFRQYNLTPVVADLESLKRVARETNEDKRALPVHLKLDTGMGRLGFSAREAGALGASLKGASYINVEGVMSHFACSERRDDYGMEQIRTFEKAIDELGHYGVHVELAHIANSGAVCQYPESHFNMVRVGIMLYGSFSDPSLAGTLPLKPVMKLASRVAYVKSFPPGVALSYGRTFVTQRNTKVAYIAAGYADGIPRALSNKGAVLLRGARCPIVGRVCMDWLLADVSGVPDIAPGDEAVVMGRSGNNTISADDIARQADTVPYEILCGVSRRIPREYV